MNAARSAEPPSRGSSKRRAPRPEEVRAILARARESGDTVMTLAVFLAALTGLRRGELAGLRWSDVDLALGTLTVRRARIPIKGSIATGPTKNGRERTIALGAFSVDLLRQHRDRLEKEAADLGAPLHEDGWVLTYDGHTPVDPSRLSFYVQALTAKMGIEGVVLHSMRHFGSTELNAGGFDTTTIAARHGHSPEESRGTYTHAVPERERQAAEYLERLLED